MNRLKPFQGAAAGWLGVVPYGAFLAIFLIVPVISNIWTTFVSQGRFSLDAMSRLLKPQYLDAFLTTINLSLVTAVLGGVGGLALAWALNAAEKPRWLRNFVLSYSAVASQLGGVPLAFAFIAALGVQGVVTRGFLDVTGWDLSQTFPLASFAGLAIVYLYFQVPLMAILMLPALGSLKQHWSEAAASLGASRWHYVRDVVFPVLWPPILGALLLLFANAFSAYATAYALAGGGVNLVPIMIGFFISGNVMMDEGFAAALVTGMIFIIVVTMTLRALLERRANKWLR
ncbi:ABC transporter permease subunit [Pseudarthrobacter sp. AL07]|uniref:ABC transporter permease n=1 Tax=unclassified Pseudarthrobacter TaxID=2647000 RepID=UPI00249CA1B3|nr:MULTISPECIES: ABC transporter permease subunit [unclassified Pseudarthrobacter]MDI3195477.1 ABC transporter permease subunit [Pseudarthrobacter sp. AL20]MDI3209544.1 ABC transporter permease subunit [Pseudarthrobacter sp. AL07]